MYIYDKAKRARLGRTTREELRKGESDDSPGDFRHAGTITHPRGQTEVKNNNLAGTLCRGVIISRTMPGMREEEAAGTETVQRRARVRVGKQFNTQERGLKPCRRDVT